MLNPLQKKKKIEAVSQIHNITPQKTGIFLTLIGSKSMQIQMIRVTNELLIGEDENETVVVYKPIVLGCVISS